MTDLFNTINAPPNDRKAFGKLLYSLIRKALLDVRARGEYQKRFADDLGIPYERLTSWTNGKLNAPEAESGRSLTPELFVKLVKMLWGMGALNSPDQAVVFARCAGKYKAGNASLSYEALLNDDWFRDLVLGPVSKESLSCPFENWVLRSEMLAQVIGKIKTTEGKFVVLFGKPGVGKSIFLTQLAQDITIRTYFTHRIYCANPNERSPLSILREWYQQSFGITPDWGDDEFKLAQELKKDFKGKHILLLIDGVEKSEQVRQLMVHDPSVGVVVIATHHLNIHRDLDLRTQLIEIPGFTENEAEEYLQTVLNTPSLDEESWNAYKAVVAWVNGNPLALHLTSHRASKIGWPAVMSLLKEPLSGRIPADMLEEVYRPLEIGYKALPPDLQEGFCLIGAIPELREYDLDVFRALWNLSDRQTENRLDQLIHNFGAFVPHQTSIQKVWRIHQQTIYYAQHLYNSQTSSLQTGNKTYWLDRYIKLTNQQVLFKQFESLFPLRKLKQAAKAEASYPRPREKGEIKRLNFGSVVSGWRTITKNSSNLSSQEYGVAYRLYRTEQSANKWFWIVLGAILFLMVSMLVLGLIFSQFTSALFLILVVFLIETIAIIFQHTYATRYRTLWHVFYKLMAERQIDPIMHKPSLEKQNVFKTSFALVPKLFKGSSWIIFIRLLFMLLIPFTLAASALSQWIGSRNDLNKYPPPGQIVSVAGHNIHLNCTGNGESTYILESGLYYGSIVWDQIQSELAENGRICSYDRAGYFWSDAVTGDRSPKTLAADLHAVLQAAMISPPYVFVAEGTGALTTYQFVQQFPGEVQSAVFIMPLSMNHVANQFPELRQLRSTIAASGALASLGFWRQNGPPLMNNFREDLRPVFRAFASAPGYYHVLGQEMDGLLASSTADYVSEGLENMPILVIAPDTYIADEELSADQVEQFWWRSFQDIMTWSSNSEILKVTGDNESTLWKFAPSIAMVIENFVSDTTH